MFKSFVEWVAHKAGYELIRRGQGSTPNQTPRPDITPEDSQILAAVRPYTMVSDERLLATIDSARYLASRQIDGAFVECGVWKGGNMMAAAYALLAAGDTGRELYLYDTFAGMSEPTATDRSHDGDLAADQLARAEKGTGVWCEAGFDEVAANLARTGYPAEKIRLVRGKVEDTIPGMIPDRIALLRLDTDWYESTRHELIHLFPRLVSRGLLIIDDYGHWEGARKAVDEYFAGLSSTPFLHRIDYTGRIGQVL